MGWLNKIKGEEPIFVFGRMLVDGEDLDLGNTGEFLIDYALANGGVPGEKKLYRNLLVPRKGATSESEIDVLMLHEKGIYVFESKNYSGWIFGSAQQRQWTMSLNSNVKKHFYNPVKQNQGHVVALEKALGLDSSCFVSFVVFSERCELKKVPANSENVKICRRHHLVRDVKRSLACRKAVFDSDQLREIAGKLDAMMHSSTDEMRHVHIEQARAVAAGEVCPRCGGELVERRRKSDGVTFIGCSAFPQCRYTRNQW